MDKIVVTVGIEAGDLTGRGNLAIQAAIDYAAQLGGGTVRIGPGVFRLDSTLHLRSRVTLEGTPGQTILLQGEERSSELAADADLHESQVTVTDPDRFAVGQTVAIRKASVSMGFGDTVAVITGKDGCVLYLDRELYSTVLVSSGGIVTTQASVISGIGCEDVQIRHLIVEGNPQNRTFAEGCRNGGIYLYGARQVEIEDCSVRDFNGDGISYQHCTDIHVVDCESVRNQGKGIHPGSGTSGTHIRKSRFLKNGMDGIFLCWRVQHSVVEQCKAAGNGMNGLSIGHKDTHNVIRHNDFSDNGYYGIFFRNEPEPSSASYNRVENNVLMDNGSENMGFVAIRIRGCTHDVELVSNRIGFTRTPQERTIGICLEEHTYRIQMNDNEFVQCGMQTHSHWLPELPEKQA
ncbi:right-handed parallel beta-helix repeat-containing protein [Paenibacillus aurantius]|uniref:Right-handed parallel beta-helix repeat-containing protein n=1 Tax=Paenibacillus aurantius TaxID=2918900 RepID=A0AA96RGD6_9BACL|nr:right-handed parallel beta-helix repeat-containing protein [Paenibacillus aurantius]WNQ12416.1 right-handed parallel beta-helix repeat-containing protein [Paenibacillus aurantius]